jgi:hypothetical protein
MTPLWLAIRKKFRATSITIASIEIVCVYIAPDNFARLVPIFKAMAAFKSVNVRALATLLK